jgi:oxalate decarboxylase/phosphoglucose isomerase-like protein (cupin superfamily)
MPATQSSFKFKKSRPRQFPGGSLWRASLKNFGALRGLAIQALHLKKGVVREPHVHPNANQLDYCVAGRARVGIVGPDGRRELLELSEGDISFVPQGFLHWIENTGPDDLSFLVILSHEEPETIELSEMLSGVPGETLENVFGVGKDFFKPLSGKPITIGGGQVM